jgi:hypothetical protein
MKLIRGLPVSIREQLVLEFSKWLLDHPKIRQVYKKVI